MQRHLVHSFQNPVPSAQDNFRRAGQRPKIGQLRLIKTPRKRRQSSKSGTGNGCFRGRHGSTTISTARYLFKYSWHLLVDERNVEGLAWVDLNEELGWIPFELLNRNLVNTKCF